MEDQTEVEVSVVTPEIALTWLTECRYEHQRNVRSAQVKFLAEEIQRGCFKQDTVIEFSVVNGVSYLTDGQHRLSAIVASGEPQRFVIVRRHLKDDITVAQDYTRTDINIVRSTADSFKTLSLETEFGRTPTQINALGVATTLILKKFSQTHQTRRVHPNDRLALMREYNPAYGLYLESIAGSRKELRHPLTRAATLGVALVTFRFSAKVYGHDRVFQFWNGLAMDDGLAKDDARKTALHHISEVTMLGSSVRGSKVVIPPFSARYLASCFNAYVTGKTIRSPKPNVSQPIRILGSPFVGD